MTTAIFEELAGRSSQLTLRESTHRRGQYRKRHAASKVRTRASGSITIPLNPETILHPVLAFTHYLTAPKVRPWTSHRRTTRPTKIIGRTVTTPIVMSLPQSSPDWVIS
jgi:hypothetical protein